MRIAIPFVAAVLWSLLGPLCAQVDPDGPAISPFRGMQRVEGGIEVQVLDDTWYALESVAEVDVVTLLREAKRLCGDRDWKRITEDLPALLDAMGHKVDGVRVAVHVRDLATGAKKQFEAVEMTHENRRRVKDANDGPLLRKLPVLGDLFGQRLAADAVAGDLECLSQLLDSRFAYRELRSVDLDVLFAEAREQLGDDAVSRRAMIGAVDFVLRQFGDGHSRVRDTTEVGPWAPFLVQRVEGGHVVFLPDRSGFVDPERPFLVAIDGVPLERWLTVAKVTMGSATMQARGRERGLRDVGGLRRALGLDQPVEVTLRLVGDDGGDERDVQLTVSLQKPIYGAWPRGKSRLLDGNVGYLRLASMDDEPGFLVALDVAMKLFRDTQGLVIDVRGNGGGSRDALRRLAPYFLPADGPPIVGNVAAVLLEDEQPAAPDALADRYLYRADWDGWSDAQRAAIGTCLKGFRPSWQLPRGRFSPWHFLVLDRSDNSNAFHYGRPVVVLIDRSCFSATDVFAAAMQAIPGVTLVGEATSGGSGRARGYRLPNSGIRLQLSTMASFRPDGVLFEGNGVVPDVAVAMQPGDLIGATDSTLARALELLR